VKYLDPALRDPLPAGAIEDTLPRNSFHVLREPGEAGTTLACTTEARVEPVILLKRIDQLRLVLGFAGRLRVFAEAACRPLPIALDLRPEQKVRFPLLAGFAEGSVERLDTPNGRVWVRFERAGETQRIGIGLGNLESLEPGAAPGRGEH
jgi:hypothetical protein